MSKKREVLDAAFSLFADKGYHMPLSEIAQSVGFQTPALYNHFENKDAIVFQLVEQEITRYFADWDRVVRKLQGRSCHDQLYGIYLSVFAYFGDVQRLRFWRNIPLMDNPELRARCRDLIRDFEQQKCSELDEVFLRGVTDGVIKPTKYPGVLYLYIAMIQGILDGMLLFQDSSFDMKDYAEKTWEAYWDGIKA